MQQQSYQQPYYWDWMYYNQMAAYNQANSLPFYNNNEQYQNYDMRKLVLNLHDCNCAILKVYIYIHNFYFSQFLLTK